MIFKEVISQHSVSEINNFAKANNLSFNMAKLLMQRGIDTDQKFIKFTSPCLQDLRDPFLLSGMRDCHNRIQKAIDKNERVLIFGDYDVDGISAVTIMHKFLKDKISNLFYFLPNRYEDGYGLSIDCSKKIIEKYNPQLIITVDCGISCEKEVDYIKNQGIDIIVTDHHEIPEVLPNTIVVDPKLPNQQYGFDGLCGAGVAMKVIETFVGRENLDEYLPVCAIATISDIVPLVDENRAIVKLGLKKQNLLPEGIKMLIAECKIPDLNSQAVSFKLAPKLNATGRMGNAYYSLDLFISDDEQTLNNSLKKVIELNVTRQKLSQQIYDECTEIVKKEKLYKNDAIIIKSKNWDSGLLGIACARLVDDYFKPVFLFSDVDGELKGSVRSIDSINIHSVLSVCSEYLETFGGHSMAAGLSLKTDDYENFKFQIYDYLKQVSKEDFLPVRNYDIELNKEDITLDFAEELNILEPIGCDNPIPLFMLKYKNLIASRLQVGNHLNITTDGIKFVAFNSSDDIENYMYAENKQTIFELQISEFREKKYLKCIVKKTIFDGYLNTLQNIAAGRLLKQYIGKENKECDLSFFEQDKVNTLLSQLLQKNCGTAIVIYNKSTFEKYKSILSGFNLNYYVGESKSKFAENCVLFAPNDAQSLYDYDNLIFLETLHSTNFLNGYTGKVYTAKNIITNLARIDMSRNCFANVYRAMREVISKDLYYSSEIELFNLTKRHSAGQKISYAQFVACLYTFLELGTVKFKKDADWSLVLDESQKTNLENSSFYNKLYFLSRIL